MRIDRPSSLRWVRVADIKVSTNAQRKLREAHADRIAREFDPDKFGIPLVNFRDGHPWVIDGQHRVAALKLMGWGDQEIQCDCYEGLTEKDEAEMFLGRNQTKVVHPFEKFMKSLTAQRDRELDIARTVAAQDLTIGQGRNEIGAVTALGKVYDRAGSARLGAALRIIRDAFGDTAFEARLIEGIGLVTHRYNGVLDESRAVEKLGRIHGGANGLIQKGAVIKRQTGRSMPESIAAATVEVINAGRGGKKIPDWWS